MWDIQLALAYLSKSSREVLLSGLEAKKRLKRLEQFVQQRKSNLNFDEIIDDDWDMQNYVEALDRYDKWESKYKWFDLRKIHLK